MFRILLLFVIACALSLVVFAQNYDLNNSFGPSVNTNQNSGMCTGGACSINSVNTSPILQHENNQYGQSTGLTPQKTGATESKGGIGGGTPFTYDFNCQFGNCIGEPTGSYKP